jgi:hypothetical protein
VKEDFQDFDEYVMAKLKPAVVNWEQCVHIDLKEPDEEYVQILFEAYYSRGD